MKALCNGFLAGVVAVSVGSGGMQPYWAIVSGLVSGPVYLLGCGAFRSFQIDDPLENIQIYILPVVWATFNSVWFLDGQSILVTDTSTLDLLGT